MGAILAKFCLGETDLNNNGVPDNKELVKIDGLEILKSRKIGKTHLNFLKVFDW